MNLGTLELNNVVLLFIAFFGLLNTAGLGFIAYTNLRRETLARETNKTTMATNVLAAETKAIALKTEINTNSLVAKLLASEKEVSRREGVDEGKKNQTEK